MATSIRKTFTHRRIALITALLLAFGMFVLPARTLKAQGQNSPSGPISFTVNGKITEASPGKLTVDSGQNMLFTVKYNSTTQIKHSDGSPAKGSDLKVGVKILAKGALTQAGDVIAKTITIKTASKGSAK